MNETLYIFGLHEEDIPKDRRNRKEICILCDRPLYLEGTGEFVGDVPDHKIDHIKYLATTCAITLGELLGKYFTKKLYE